MSETPNLGLSYLEEAQAQKHVTVNEALRRLDALVQIAVADRDLTEPPASPAEGARYLVAGAGSGAWAGQGGKLACRQDGAWSFIAPGLGWLVHVVDESRTLVRASSGWLDLGASLQAVPFLGVLATADAANRLAVKSNGVLMSHDDVTPGTGDLRLTLNRATAARDAAIALQSGFATRMLLGLLGDDRLTIKASADGTTYRTALTVEPATGAVALPQGPKFSAWTNFDNTGTANLWTKVQFNNADHNAQNAFAAATNRFVAPFAGVYALSASATYKLKTTAPTGMALALYKNGTAVARSQRSAAGLASGVTSIAIAEALTLAANDFVEVFVRFDTNDGYVDQTASGFRGWHLP